MNSSLPLLSPSSSSPHHWKYHVFPSFRGEDVRRNLLCHVLPKFRSKGINVFVDNRMESSTSISPELKEAIRGSRIAIVILSKNYASSTWCLDELVEIMKCRKELTQIVISLFYEVDPTDIKKQTADFGEVFKTTCIGKTEEAIRRWKDALTEVAQIKGYHSTKWEDEAEMIEAIATDVSDKLNNSTPSNDFDRLVGMESQMTKMVPFLQLDSDKVRTIGILGRSGIGKTTIARYVFSQLSPDFQLSVFMDNIKTKYATPACSDDYSVKLNLQRQLMAKLTNDVGIMIPHLGIAKDRLKGNKVLLVLDDVDRLVQLEAMAEETCWFGPGSRIIITTQDENILKAGGIENIYRVDLPSTDESLQMLCMYAFGQKSPKDGFTELASEVMCLVGGLPLWLRVMGTYFKGKCKEDWRKALLSLKTSLDPDWEIESILKVRYDALCDKEKRLFLHIACFFNYERVDVVEDCLPSFFLDVKQGLRALSKKYLISVDSGWIQMHELLVQLGRKIARVQSVDEPERPQFLSVATDIGEVLNNDKAGSSSVVGINDLDRNITCTSERAFERLSNLQFLRINGDGINPQSLNSVSEKIIFLRWQHFGMTSFPSSFNRKFLVKLEMPFSRLKKLWEETQQPNNLKWMDLSHSKCLKKLPNLSAINLVSLNLKFCSSLVKLLSSSINEMRLKKLNLSHCSSLVKFSIGNADSLEKLNLSHCSSLVEFSIGNANSLEKLNLSHCSSLVEFSIGNVNSLKKLNLSHCSSLVEFSISNANSLRKLNLNHCSSLVEFSIGNAVSLEKLNLSHCSSLMELPYSILIGFDLQYLDLTHCSRLVELPSSIENARNLQKLDLSYCSSLVELPSSIGNAINLQELNLYGCSSLVELPSSMRNLRKLSALNLEGCSKLEVFLANINLESLEYLNLSWCSLLKSDPVSSTNIQDLNPSGTRVKEASSSQLTFKSEMCETERRWRLWPLPSTLKMRGIQELDPWVGRISCLRRLVLSGMKNLVTLPQLPYSVVELCADECESLERLDCSFRNPGIRLLSFRNCFKLNQEARDLIIQTPTNEYAVLPGGELPQCFINRSSGGTLTVQLNQKPLGTSTKFKACIISANEVEHGYVSCTITSKENAITYYEKIDPRNLRLCTFEVETEEVTSTKLVFEFDVYNDFRHNGKGKIKECGILQIPDVHYESFRDGDEDYEPSHIEI